MCSNNSVFSCKCLYEPKHWLYKLISIEKKKVEEECFKKSMQTLDLLH